MLHSAGDGRQGGSVLEAGADAYVAYLHSHGYAANTVRAYLASVGHFGHWLSARRLPLRRLDDAVVRQFVTEHLPTCTCPARRQRTPHQVRAALRQLLRMLRAAGDIAAPRDRMPPAIHDELEHFGAHLARTCGLAPATCRSRLRWAGIFLRKCFGSAAIRLDAISTRAVFAFIVQAGKDAKPGRARTLGGALRSYFRFRAVTCGDRVDGLLAAIPTVAQWRLSTLPSHLTPAEVSRFLAAFDRRRPGGRRGYAMARCMLDLGLRASEVAALQLEDLNWEDGTLTIRRGKSRRADILPLPGPTGQALVEYVRRARPQRTSRSVFVRHRAPLDAPVTTACVRSAIRIGYSRCDLAQRYTGTHVLRHTAATRMRCAGASLKEVADVLRHRSLDTTTIYTKVDAPRLAAVAAPWPGGTS